MIEPEFSIGIEEEYLLVDKDTMALAVVPEGLMAYNIWLTVIAIALTGYMMTTMTYFGIDWVEETHEVLFGWLVFSVALHVAGVAFDTWRSGVNLVRAMVTGRKIIPRGRDVE
jgi:cytochrome b